ncbi:lipoyl synthase [Porphyromonas macacae]|uniref:Lipoyl synthase n=1 Tax=Porphyromonas macacae TaxID=28115 RepID=A0A379DH70_9PORP|nr:lipoyl synthase [Porphyromonas macacae]SUB77383.1 Lipoyl synthase [Porphyromonas macacae]
MTPTKHVKKPDWLKIKLGDNEQFTYTKQVLEKHCLHTICTSGRCPNQGECWNRGTATFMIGGDICTRSCRFCNTKSGRPAPLNPDEPEQLATSVGLMKLKHAVVTSVDRDDLPDFGAAHWVNCIEAIKKRNPDTTLEVLIPDFRGRLDLVDLIIDAGPNVISHNLETVRRLTPSVRSVATYDTSMNVLRHIAASGISAKTGIMLGLGETEAEILELMDEVLAAGVSTITIGQYLQPTRKHLPVSEYVTPEQFEKIRLIGIKKGFKNIECAPLVRSSYHAERHV